jgi:hypothetical protein
VVVIVVVMVPIWTVPSTCLNDAPHIAAIIDLLPKINRGSIVKAGLGWSFALRSCVTLVARWASGLLYLLLDIAKRKMRALVALAIVVPPVPGAFSRGATNLCGVTIALLKGMFRVEDTGCCISSCMSARWVRYCSLCIWGLGCNC